MTQFALFALLLLAVVAAFLLPPLWRTPRRAATVDDRKTANLAIFRDQLAELERERREGTLADADFEHAKTELQRRLLEEVDPDSPTQTTAAAPSRKTALILGVLLPVLALGAYGLLGNPRALDPAQTAPQAKVTPDQINAMVAKLAARMQENPDDMQGWLMLARSYKSLGRYEDAVNAYGKAEKALQDDPDLLASYAETLAMARGEGLKGKPAALVQKALKLNPNHGHSLFLAGAAAMEAGDRKQAIKHWEALLPQVEPGSEIDQMLRGGIEKMKAGN